MQVAVWIFLRSEEYRNQWNCAWEGTDNGNLVVNTAWGQQRKKHMWNITERKCHRKNLWGSILQGESEQPRECCAFVQRLRKKSYEANKWKISNAQRATGEKPWLLELNSHSWNSVPSHEPREDSSSVLGTGFFLHLVPLMEMTTSAPIFLLTYPA